jgi:hypothetical protein
MLRASTAGEEEVLAGLGLASATIASLAWVTVLTRLAALVVEREAQGPAVERDDAALAVSAS